MRQIVKEKVVDTYSYISGELLCALVPLFVDGMLRNTNKKIFSKWSHQNIFTCFFVITRPKLLLFNNKCKTVKICQNAFTPNQGDTPLYDINFETNTKDFLSHGNKWTVDISHPLTIAFFFIDLCEGSLMI